MSSVLQFDVEDILGDRFPYNKIKEIFKSYSEYEKSLKDIFENYVSYIDDNKKITCEQFDIIEFNLIFYIQNYNCKLENYNLPSHSEKYFYVFVYLYFKFVIDDQQYPDGDINCNFGMAEEYYYLFDHLYFITSILETTINLYNNSIKKQHSIPFHKEYVNIFKYLDIDKIINNFIKKYNHYCEEHTHDGIKTLQDKMLEKCNELIELHSGKN